jgi:FMN-dependent NADH-azoreductase
MGRILGIDASLRRGGSVTRALTDAVVERLGPAGLVVRDLAEGVPHVDDAWIGARFTDPAERTEARRAALAGSDALVAELRAADTVVIGAPVCTFGVPAGLKARVDQSPAPARPSARPRRARSGS